MFGLLHDTHSTPSITVLMMSKSSELYKRMWQKVEEKLDELGALPALNCCNFDCEKAAFNIFHEVFGVGVNI
uniref:Uncharacterized protein n=1 Tax=Ditylenchus dipsaci TaxID=166011 RepID=A0A915E2B4_9BILA